MLIFLQLAKLSSSCYKWIDHKIPQHENGDLRKIKGGLNVLKIAYPTLRYQLNVVKGR